MFRCYNPWKQHKNRCFLDVFRGYKMKHWRETDQRDAKPIVSILEVNDDVVLLLIWKKCQKFIFGIFFKHENIWST